MVQAQFRCEDGFYYTEKNRFGGIKKLRFDYYIYCNFIFKGCFNRPHEFSRRFSGLFVVIILISVGYRVKSLQGTQFRQWATQRLKDYLVKGYAINKKRLEQKNRKLYILKPEYKY